MENHVENYPEKLVQMVKEVSKPTLRLRLKRGSDELYERSHLISHFKGRPCFSVDDAWPTCSFCGKPLHLMLQLSALQNPEFELPENADILQFFYCTSCRPYHNDEPGWLVRLVDDVDFRVLMEIDPPEGADLENFCEVKVERVTVAPDWELLYVEMPEFVDRFRALCDGEASVFYKKIVSNLAMTNKLESHFEGYPTWLQSVDTPYYQGNPLKFILQIDSEDDAGLNWVDMGLVYLFYEESTAQFYFEMQFM